MSKKIKVLFVCMGNICRSPTAHGVFRHLVNAQGLQDSILIDSAGTHAYHIGEPPDHRSQLTARHRGIEMSDLRARRVTEADFEQFDYVLAMDDDNYRILDSLCPSHHQDKLRMFLEFTTEYSEREVPDPYYGGSRGFEHVFDLVESASRGLLEDIRRQHL